jgi:hypothetical protein
MPNLRALSIYIKAKVCLWVCSRCVCYCLRYVCVCQSQSYVTTDDQSVSKSWFQGPSGSHDRIFISVFVQSQSQSHITTDDQ